MGMYVDESPVSSDYLNPETPSMTKLAYTAGVTFRPCKWMHVDLAYGYVNSADPERTGSYPYVNSVLALANEQIKNVAPEYPTTSAITDFSSNYTARAHVLHRRGVQFLKTEKFTIFAVRLATDAPHC